MNKLYRTFVTKNLTHHVGQSVDKILNTVNAWDPTFEIISISTILAENNEFVVTTIILKTTFTEQV